MRTRTRRLHHIPKHDNVRVQRRRYYLPKSLALLYPLSQSYWRIHYRDKSATTRAYPYSKQPPQSYRKFDSADYTTSANQLVKTQNRKNYFRRVLVFADSRRTIVCQRRKTRRVALFARHKVGTGKKVSRIRRRTEESDIICK